MFELSDVPVGRRFRFNRPGSASYVRIPNGRLSRMVRYQLVRDGVPVPGMTYLSPESAREVVLE